MTRRSFLQVLPGIWLALWPVVGAAAEQAVAYLRIDGMT